jgi:hypothetical protein
MMIVAGSDPKFMCVFTLEATMLDFLLLSDLCEIRP